MKYVYLIFLSFILFGCINHSKNINANWQQIFIGFEGEKEGHGIVSDSAIIHLNLKQPYKIQFDYNDGLEADFGDSIEFNYPQLNFRKQNYNKTYNRYQMRYDESCDCFNGVFKSFSGNRVKVKWIRK